jgi:hypothetical protein
MSSKKHPVEIPRYMRKALRELPNVQITPGLHIMNVYHDDWCDFLAGLGPCNCNPDVVLPFAGRN